MPFMVLELLAGGSLRGMLDAGIRLSPSAGRARGPAGRERARVRARPRGRAPRHQARQPAVRRARHRARRRLRTRPRPRRGELDRAGGRGRRHRALRGARAGDGRAARRPRRPLLARASCWSRRSPAPSRSSPTPPSARSRRARTHRSSRRSRSGALGPVVERAGRPDPAERYPDAATMRAALADAAARSRRPNRSRSRDSVARSTAARPPRSGGRRTSSTRTRRSRHRSSWNRRPSRRPSVAGARPGRCAGSRYAVIAAILLALVGGGIAIAAVSTEAGTVAVPSLVGLTQAKATDALASTGLSLKIVTRTADDPAANGDRPASGAGRVRGRRRLGPTRRVARSAAGRDHDHGGPGAGGRAGGARGPGLRRRGEAPVRRDGARRRRDQHRPGRRRQVRARFRPHAVGERRTGTGPGARRQRPDLRRGVTAAHRGRVHGVARSTTSATPSTRTR